MPRAVPVALRRQVFRLVDQGKHVADVAARLGISARTIRRLLLARRLHPDDHEQPRYHACGRPKAPCPEALDLRRQHPLWGAPYIHTALREGCPRGLPSVRTLQRHLRQAGLAPAPPGRKAGQARPRAPLPHHTWQMDACERVPLRTGAEVSWLRAADEHTGAFLRTRVFPPGVLAAGAPGADASVLA